MTWPAIAICFSAFSAVVTVVGAAYTYGALTTKVGVNSEKLGSHSTQLGVLSTRMGDVEIHTARLEEWRDGFRAGTIHAVAADPTLAARAGETPCP